MHHFRALTIRALTSLAVMSITVSALGAQDKKLLPLKYAGPPTKAEISAADLMTRLYKYADDSMMGRLIGTEGNMKATAYIESEVRRLGLQPGGDNGTYFQTVGMFDRRLDSASTITIDGKTFTVGTDFIAQIPPTIRQFSNTPVIFGGQARDTLNLLDSASVAGKILLVTAAPPLTQATFNQLNASAAYRAYVRSVSGAARVITISTAPFSAPMLRQIFNSTLVLGDGPSFYPQLNVSSAMADAMLGVPVATATKGAIGKNVTSDIKAIAVANPRGRNVVAILPGSDPKLKGEYVAIGAHNDHVGFAPRTIGQHDSLRIVNTHIRPAGAEGGRNQQTNPVTTEEWAKINADIAELRKTYPERSDSIFNGADDDGSGTVSVLEIAEAFAKGSVKPKRSLIFVWHTGEESGMWGSGYFMDHPSVPRDSIVAQLNIDMVGRGAATDVTGQAKSTEPSAPGAELHGGDHYVQLVGSRRLSTELGDLVEKVNTDKKHGFVFDYNIDADGHQQNIYCRSDHWSYAKWGVPVVFFTTGGHADYHQVTDEPQYIQYEHMASIDKLIFDIAAATANLDHRVVVDHAKPNPAPATACRQ